MKIFILQPWNCHYGNGGVSWLETTNVAVTDEFSPTIKLQGPFVPSQCVVDPLVKDHPSNMDVPFVSFGVKVTGVPVPKVAEQLGAPSPHSIPGGDEIMMPDPSPIFATTS